MMLNASSKTRQYIKRPYTNRGVKPGTITPKSRCVHELTSTECVLCFPDMFCFCSGDPERNSICPGSKYQTPHGLWALQGCQTHDNVSICAHPDLFTCFGTKQDCVVCQKKESEKENPTKTAGKTRAVFAACGPAVEGFFDRYIANSTASGKLGRVPIQDRTQQQEYYFATTKHLARVLAEVYAQHPEGLSDDQALEKACEIAKTSEFVATHNKNLAKKETKAAKAIKAMGQAAGQPALVGEAGSAGPSGSAGSAGNFMPAPALLGKRPAAPSNIAQQDPKRQAVPVAYAMPVANVDSLVAAGSEIVQALPFPQAVVLVIPAPVVTYVAAPVVTSVAAPAPAPAPAPVVTSVAAPAPAPALSPEEILAAQVLMDIASSGRV